MTERSYLERQITAKLQVVRYMIALADSRNISHGDKHHFHEVALFILVEVLRAMGDETISWITPRDTTDAPENVGDIPF